MKKNTFYITTPLYYVNDEPHIGHAYTTILADVIARFQKNMDNNVYFLTGTDEHGQKVQEASQKRNMSPQNHADEYVERFVKLWKKLNIEYDDFIRTTEKRHTDRVEDLLMILWEKGEIYQDEYEGLYSVSEERFITEKEYETGEFREVKKIKEKNYFFKMSKYQKQLIDHIQKKTDFIRPESRKNEILGFLNKPLNDLCISRPKSRLNWGIELPFDEEYVTYVWFDALTNYISSIGWNSDENKFNELWPANYHLIGKDIITTHAVYWSTMLLAANIELPKSIFAHGWWLMNDTKMSKSLGNVVKPLDLIDEFGSDALRYYLMRNMVVGQDANFTYDLFIKRYNSDLANDYGNVVNRVLVLIDKYFESKVPCPGDYNKIDIELIGNFKSAYLKISNLIKDLKIHDAAELIFSLIRLINKYLEKKEPWKTVKENSEDKGITATTLFISIEAIRICSLLLNPIMPNKTSIVLDSIGIKSTNIKQISFGEIAPGQKINLISTLFPRIDL
tara:strand:+ start:456 stop:1973 length:1518 start_codon:yes stop_codon:yes gene_type:complete